MKQKVELLKYKKGGRDMLCLLHVVDIVWSFKDLSWVLFQNPSVLRYFLLNKTTIKWTMWYQMSW